MGDTAAGARIGSASAARPVSSPALFGDGPGTHAVARGSAHPRFGTGVCGPLTRHPAGREERAYAG
ncbi:hypothetical protein GCM10027294_34720 [Marinactinospora endophytica]